MVNPIFMLFNGGMCGLLSQGVPLEEEEQENQISAQIPVKTRFLGSHQSDWEKTRFLT
jgi:hypothetical protein